MPTALEIEINQMLSRWRDHEKVAHELVRRWRLNLLSEPEAEDCAQFLIASGQHRLLLNEIRRLIDQSTKLPWAQFAEALGRSGVKPSDHEVECLFAGANEQEAVPSLIRSRQLDLHSRRFTEMRTEIKEWKKRAMNDRRQSLRSQIQFMRSQRMFEKELELIDEYERIFPAETEISREKEDLRFRWAREIVAKSRSEKEHTANHDLKFNVLSTEEEQARTVISNAVRESASRHPVHAYDLAIGLQMMDLPTEALSVLAFAPDSKATDWLRLELMIQGRQFVTALENAVRLEEKYPDDPETAFATTYARARALRGLGETNAAIETLRGLLRVRPGYRSAQTLLSDWSGGEE